MMNKQNQRLIPIAPQLVEMMDMVTTDQEIDYLLQMGTGLFDYKQALELNDRVALFFDRAVYYMLDGYEEELKKPW